MSFTFCLVTKGRIDFVQPLIDSLKVVLTHNDFHLFVILNGASTEYGEHFLRLKYQFDDKITIKTIEYNDVRPSSYWNYVLEVKTDWIMFLNDDDVIRNDVLDVMPNLLKRFQEYDVITSSLAVIDNNGVSSGEIRVPSFNMKLSRVEQFADAFHQIPFLWPGLIIKSKVLPQKMVESRYVYDWWLGLNLMLTCSIVSTDIHIINYRVHSSQESNLASLRRKNLEALFHFTRFVKSEQFRIFVQGLSQAETLGFLNILATNLPIYGDPLFGRILFYFIVYEVIHCLNSKSATASSLLILSKAMDTVMTKSQLRFFTNLDSNLERVLDSNIHLKCQEFDCDKLRMIAEIFPSNNFALDINIHCRHSQSISSKSLFIDCDVHIDQDNTEDQIAFYVQNQLELAGIFSPAVSIFEYSLIMKYRKLKKLIPGAFLLKLRRIIVGKWR